MTAHRHLLFCAALAVATSSCQADLGQSPTEPSTTSLIQAEGVVARTPLVFLLVADDANSIEAAELRERVTQSVREGLIHEYDEVWRSCLAIDPAQWQPSDIRIVVARPSAPDGEALLTPVDTPSLAWITNNASFEDIAPIANATLDALGKRLALPGEAYRPLRATSRAVDLLTGTRPPLDALESAFVASLPKDFHIRVVVASTRDDEDIQPIEQLQPTVTAGDRIFRNYLVVGPSAAGNSVCDVYPLGNSRLEQWSDSLDANFHAWPCGNDDVWNGLARGAWADCAPWCFSRAIDVSPDGFAACRIFVDQLDLTRCDATNGWKDPDGKPTFFTHYETLMRRCEIVQHTGTNLEACRHSRECTDCPGGFCVTEVPSLGSSGPGCAGDDVLWPIRFTGGAIATNYAWLTMLCDTGKNP